MFRLNAARRSHLRSVPLTRLAQTAQAAVVCLSLGALATNVRAQSGPSDPVEDQYRLGLYLRETGQPYSAIETLESLLAANPTLNRARLELAVAYYRTLNFSRARAQAQQVLDDPKTPEAVRLSVLSFLKKIELEEAAVSGKRNRFEPSVSLGFLYDSNVNAGPDNALLPGGFVLNANGLSHGDRALVEQAGVTHTWQRQQPVRIGESTARLSWVSQANLYHRGYFDQHDYNLSVVTLATGPALQFQGGNRGNVNIQLDHITFGGEYLGLYSSISPSYTWRLGNGELTADGQWVKRDFHRSDDEGRDSYYRAAGLSYGHLLNRGLISVQTGANTFSESAKQARFSNRGYEVFIGGRWRAWNNGDLFTRAALRRSHYEGPDTFFGEARNETERRLELGASHKFVSGWLDQWLLSATLSYVNNGANLSLYEYTRNTATLTLGRSF